MKRFLSLMLAVMLALCCVSALADDAWKCDTCGAENVTKFCVECGAKRPQQAACTVCGFQPEIGRTYKFCPNCGVKFGEAEPTAAPTATPAPTPAERSFYINRISVHDGGVATVEWIDTEDKGPYKVCYEFYVEEEYAGDKQIKQTRWVAARDVAEKTAEVEYLVPGVPYWITVFDADGEMAAVAYKPVAAEKFTEFSMTPTVEPRARMGTEIFELGAFSALATEDASDAKEFGLYIRLDHEQMTEKRVYRAVIGITAPDGTVFIDMLDDEFDLAAGRSYTFWNFYNLNTYFQSVKNMYDEIPTGEYTLSLYLDGQFVTSAPFTMEN
ncbi:MAG: hypothetical protein IKK21_04715 [Clostridia bacterium]|nr:hypothetical protein [Clostridia bacterium]